eukprot:2208925-Prymnesium_polylepis.1
MKEARKGEARKRKRKGGRAWSRYEPGRARPCSLVRRVAHVKPYHPLFCLHLGTRVRKIAGASPYALPL